MRDNRLNPPFAHAFMEHSRHACNKDGFSASMKLPMEQLAARARALAFVLCATVTNAACALDENEIEPFLPAATLVQAALLSGPDFRVLPEVRIRGYMAQYVIDTKYGPLRADSSEVLALRVAELPALDALDRASRTQAFAHALAARGTKTGAAIVNVFAHPVDTITGLPQGVARYFGAKWDLWTNRAQTVADRSSREFENNGDPYRAPPGPMTAARGVPDEPQGGDDGKKNRAWYARAGNEAGRETKRYLKYGQQRREMAKVLGIDPNSTNPLLNQKLDELAWAAVWGNFSAGAALGQVAGTAADVVSWTGKLNQYVLEKPPQQLREENRARLAKFCSDDFAVRQFLRRGGFSDTLRTALAQSVENLQPRDGCNELVDLAATTHGDVEARYLVDALKMLEREPDARGGTLLAAGAAIAWRTPSGRLLLPLPVDYLSWNAQLAQFFDQPAFAIADKLALIAGDASAATQRQLTQRGWGLKPRTPFDGAPAYAQGDFSPLQPAS
jgi:hypothetical protein